MVLKGYTKNLIVVRNLENSLIDEAYLILKRGALQGGDEQDIVREANRILTGTHIPIKRKTPAGGAFWFLLGSVLSGLASSVLWLCLGP